MDTKQFNDILAKVPGSFKAKLERIRRYLVLGKASVMVGAGFSRNADVPVHLKVKQWNDVGEDIYRRLRNVEKVDNAELVFKTPIRLASQFAAMFGRNELDNLIKDSLPDDRMNPGTLHRQLLSLPWRDVFTTNYDTLLERARKGLLRPYSVVTSKEMLLYKPSPRIVKLHGSFPDKTPFLMTEEDYRTYPTEHPEFVNTVRQALVESIFCLIGFSGDDPNFTSWQGWLRDVMGDYAGPSYLITCDKHYDESFKILMEKRGIQVLNFSEIEGLENHKVALDFFFTYLSDSVSPWKGYVDYNPRKINAVELTEQFKKVRESYPGWFILPKKYMGDFYDMSRDFPYLEAAFNTIKQENKEALLYELDWRADISLTFKDFDWYRENLEQVIQEYGDNALSNEAITLGISLLRLYRHHPEKQREVDVLKNKLAQTKNLMTQYQLARFTYTVACNALSVLDYDTVVSTLKEWDVSKTGYAGIVYKSLVLAESSDVSAAIELLNEAYENITQSLVQNTTQEELSLRCVIENLMAFYEKKRMPDNDRRFSFIDMSEYIHSQAQDNNSKSFEITHGFGIGASSKSWNWESGTNKDLLYPYRYLLLCENYGLPYGLVSNPVDEKKMSSILSSMAGFNLNYSLGPVLRCGSRKVVEDYLTRSVLSNISRNLADELAKYLLSVAGQESCEKARTYRAVNVLLPFLSRLSTKCSVVVVVDIYKFALTVYCKSPYSKPEDLMIIYANVMPDGLQEVYETAYSSDILIDSREMDVTLPYANLKYYTPSSRAVDVVCHGLRSDNKLKRKLAYFRAVYLMESSIKEKDKNRLVEQIREWRFKENICVSTKESYSKVPPTKLEGKVFCIQVDDDVNSFLKQDYSFKGSSSTISSLESHLIVLIVEVDFLGENQVSAIIDKLADVLDINYSTFSKDDSGETMGGLRHFTLSCFKKIGEFVRHVFDKNLLEVKTSAKLFKVLQRYLSSHLPVRITLERLNIVARVISHNNMRDIITSQLFSENEVEVLDSCNALVSYISHKGNFQTALQNIIFYCNYAESDKMRYYLQMLSMIPLEKMTHNTQKCLAEMIRLFLERSSKRNLSVEQMVDVMHDGFCLAASLKNAPSNSPVVESVRLWEEYADDETVFNDVRLPWFFY